MWAEQLKAARSIAGLEQSKLAEMSGVSIATIKRFESMAGPIDARTSTVAKLKEALELAGVLFIDQNGAGPGVRLAKRADGTSEPHTKTGEE